MTTSLTDLPTLLINQHELSNLLAFIYKHEHNLRFYGGIKIQLDHDCQLALRKRKKKLELAPNLRKIVKMTQDEAIYVVNKIDHMDDIFQGDLWPMDEGSFWSSLSHDNAKARLLNTNTLSNKSFFCDKTARSYFDIHRLPAASLLKLAGKAVTNQFVPTVTRAFGAGAIFPLATAPHHLFSIHYHHEGSPNYWYIIPMSERHHLQRKIDQYSTSLCLEHEQLFIDPSVFDKNHMRYYRTVQHANEFIVLYPGSLAQNFAAGVNWGESIVFALPSWLEEVHFHALTLRCKCRMSYNLASPMIDISLFQSNAVQKYIKSYLTNNITNKSSSNTGISDVIDSRSNLVLIQPKETLAYYSQSSASSLMRTPMDSYFSSVAQFNTTAASIPPENTVLSGFKELDDFGSVLPNYYDSGSANSMEQSCSFNVFNQDIHQTALDQTAFNDSFSSYEELLVDLSSVMSNNQAMFQHFEKDASSNVVSVPSSSVATSRSTNEAKTYKAPMNRTSADKKTLFVSGLKSNVTVRDLRKCFVGCTKIVMKTHRTNSSLKYAFITHRTRYDADLNIRKAINHSVLGSSYEVEYANGSSSFLSDHQNLQKKKLAIRNIPMGVDENQLRTLLNNPRILNYCSARMVPVSAKDPSAPEKKKVLPGFAFVLYDDEESAASIIKYSDQYHILGHVLKIAYYRQR